jgi:hypothetical protein
LGGLVYFFWLGISWSSDALHKGVLQGLPDSQQTSEWLAGQSLGHDRLYYYPSMLPGESEPKFSDRVSGAPVIALLNFLPAGQYRITVLMFVRAFIAALLAGVLLTVLVAGAQREAYWQRVLLASIFGLAAFLAEPLISGVFLFYPARHVAMQALDLILGWTLAGLVIAAFTRPANLRHTVPAPGGAA